MKNPFMEHLPMIGCARCLNGARTPVQIKQVSERLQASSVDSEALRAFKKIFKKLDAWKSRILVRYIITRYHLHR